MQLKEAIDAAIVMAERDVRYKFTQEQRDHFRMGFVFGVNWYQDRVKAMMDENKEDAA